MAFGKANPRHQGSLSSLHTRQLFGFLGLSILFIIIWPQLSLPSWLLHNSDRHFSTSPYTIPRSKPSSNRSPCQSHAILILHCPAWLRLDLRKSHCKEYFCKCMGSSLIDSLRYAGETLCEWRHGLFCQLIEISNLAS